MKTEVVEGKPEYPCLMVLKNGSLIVLFHQEEAGTVVVPDECWWIGRYSETWSMGSFKKFSGTVTLEN